MEGVRPEPGQDILFFHSFGNASFVGIPRPLNFLQFVKGRNDPSIYHILPSWLDRHRRGIVNLLTILSEPSCEKRSIACVALPSRQYAMCMVYCTYVQYIQGGERGSHTRLSLPTWGCPVLWFG